MTKEEFLKKLEGLDMSNPDTAYDNIHYLVDDMPRGYARGFLDANLGVCNCTGVSFDEDLKYSIKQWCNWFQWE